MAIQPLLDSILLLNFKIIWMAAMKENKILSKAKLYCDKIYTKVLNSIYFYDDTPYTKEENQFGK